MRTGHDPGLQLTELEQDGQVIGAIVHDAALAGDDELIRSVRAAAVLALENERLTLQVRANVSELHASRARIVAAGYEQRKRLERDLHDGAQQRLMAVGMSLQLARMKAEAGSAEVPELIDEAIADLAAATAELRELARGIHPAVLTDFGLGPAIKMLAARSPIPVKLAVASAGRLPAAVEAAAYFVIAESITNVSRYAQAALAQVNVDRIDGRVRIEVIDDGLGGADPARGSGLRGLTDRVAALDGELHVSSPAGVGTTISAWIPCGS
jgi:signal transduction histidine kinase